MKLEVVSWPLCPYVHRVTTLLHEKKAPFDLKYVDLANKPEWFLAISPMGRVPVVVADGTPLFESLALNEFVDEVFAPRFLPEAPIPRAQHRAYVRFAEDLFNGLFDVLVGPNLETYEKGKSTVKGLFGTFEKALQGPLFAGEAFSLVDAAAAPVLQRCVILQKHAPAAKLFEGFPKVERWAATLADRKSVNAGVPADFLDAYMKRARASKGYFATTFLQPQQ